MMTPSEMLRALGYGGTVEEFGRFQRDYNKVFPASVLITGKLDRHTADAAKIAYSARAMFEALRDDKPW